ncbi:GGDEF domain-containing protein [Altericroceibacterium indicum]|nr:GGDEF domain-containing protein [Altericroceibacterium indicum]
MVDIGFAQAGIFVVLATLCMAVFYVLRSHKRVLGWLFLAMVLCFIETLALTVAQSSTDYIAFIIILLGGAVFCINFSISALLNDNRQYYWVDAFNLSLLALSIAILYTPTPYILQNIPFQLACALGIWKSTYLLATVSEAKWQNLFLASSLFGIGAIFFIRASVYPFIFPINSKYYEVVNSAAANKLVVTILCFAMITVLTIVSRVITEVITEHRTNAERDLLTGLLNRAAFDKIASEESKSGDALILCDLDHFKQVNDQFGHLAGDEVLRNFASILQGTGYMAGRFGGEEFALLMPGHNGGNAAALAQNIRRLFIASVHKDIPDDHMVTASFGIAIFHKEETLTEAFRRADESLYHAKRTGRNRVEIAPPPRSPFSSQPVWSPLVGAAQPITHTGRPT